MKTKKQIQNIVNKAVEASFKDEKIILPKALKFVDLFKKESISDSVTLLSAYLKSVKARLNKTTLVVESATPLSKSAITKLSKKLSSDFKILDSKFILDSTLLGGTRVKIGDYILEDSIKSRIKQVVEVIHG